jgi:hypothetical protein
LFISENRGDISASIPQSKGFSMEIPKAFCAWHYHLDAYRILLAVTSDILGLFSVRFIHLSVIELKS